jgi:hypothetical protein
MVTDLQTLVRGTGKVYIASSNKHVMLLASETRIWFHLISTLMAITLGAPAAGRQ